MAPNTLEIGTATHHVETVFLAALSGDAALDAVERHVRADIWEPADRLRLALALVMRLRNPPQAFERVRALIPQVRDDEKREFVVAGLLEFGEKSLSDVQQTLLRKELRTVSRIAEELYAEGIAEGEIERAREIARRMLAQGASVARVAAITDLPVPDVEAILRESNPTP